MHLLLETMRKISTFQKVNDLKRWEQSGPDCGSGRHISHSLTLFYHESRGAGCSGVVMYDLLGTQESWPGIYVSLAARSPHQERLLLINQTQEPNPGLTSLARVTPLSPCPTRYNSLFLRIIIIPEI